MNKTELVDEIAEAANLSKSDAEKALSAFMSAVQGALVRGDKVALPGWGTFSVSQRAARTGRNPLTGAVINIAASSVPRFAPGSTFKAALNSTKGK